MRIVTALTWTVGALLIVLDVSFAWGRLRPPTEVQVQALELMKPVPPSTGAPNAWSSFWLLDYDVPVADVEAVYAQERVRLDTWAKQLPQNTAPVTSYPKWVAQHFPKLPEFNAADREKLCRMQDPDCLAKVRANVRPLRELLARQSGRLTRLRAIPTDAVLWDQTPTTPHTPLPAFEAANPWFTAAALDFSDGRQLQALAQVCRGARTVRHMHAHTNSLIGAMVTARWMGQIEQLLAGMSSELPADQPLPADCTKAFAPVIRADVNMCASMQREYQFGQAGIMTVDPARQRGLVRLRMRLLVDTEGVRRLIAPRYAWPCQSNVVDNMLDDQPLSSTQSPDVRYDFFDAVSNPLGLRMARLPIPDYASYLNRNEDYAAGLRAMAWLLTNRGTATTPDDWRRQLATALPALQQRGRRDVELDPPGERLIVPYSEQRPHHLALVLQLMK